jgi:putative Mg2+ transporter-C (MgtC) family protein
MAGGRPRRSPRPQTVPGVASSSSGRAVYSGQHGVDPTRIAAYVVSGIGFLGAGVILRDGIHVRGINTAATIWCSAAIGVLAGAGYLPAAALILTAHLALRPLAQRVDRLPATADTEIQTIYQFRAVTRAADEAHIRPCWSAN